MSDYHSFGKEKFEKELPEGFNQTDVSGTNEYVYELELDEEFKIRIHSSVDMKNDRSRDSGNDAIRVSLYHESSDEIIGYDSRTHRIMDDDGNPKWPENMRKKIQKLKNEYEKFIHDCPVCDGYLREIDYNDGFYGCVNYPDCDFTASIGEDGEPEYDENDVESAEEKKKWKKVEEFLKAKKNQNDFYQSLYDSLQEYGELTDNQLECIEDEVEIYFDGNNAENKYPLSDELDKDEEKLLKRYGLGLEGPSWE